MSIGQKPPASAGGVVTDDTAHDWIELRPDDCGLFDEMVTGPVDMVHLEMMDEGVLWICLYRGEERQVVWAQARKGKQLEVRTRHDG